MSFSLLLADIVQTNTSMINQELSVENNANQHYMWTKYSARVTFFLNFVE